MSKKKVATAVVEALRNMGVRHVFGVPSGGWVDYMEALRTTDGIDFILATHEGGAGMMADVCGRLTGVPGGLLRYFRAGGDQPCHRCRRGVARSFADDRLFR